MNCEGVIGHLTTSQVVEFTPTPAGVLARTLHWWCLDLNCYLQANQNILLHHPPKQLKQLHWRCLRKPTKNGQTCLQISNDLSIICIISANIPSFLSTFCFSSRLPKTRALSQQCLKPWFSRLGSSCSVVLCPTCVIGLAYAAWKPQHLEPPKNTSPFAVTSAHEASQLQTPDANLCYRSSSSLMCPKGLQLLKVSIGMIDWKLNLQLDVSGTG